VQLARDHVPDVVLCDIGLPDMNGFDVATALRGDEATREVALIAISGYGRPEDRARCQAAGFDDHLTKPVDLRTIERTIARHRRAS
jgi:two-component system CheB/CheR fusion protein